MIMLTQYLKSLIYLNLEIYCCMVNKGLGSFLKVFLRVKCQTHSITFLNWITLIIRGMGVGCGLIQKLWNDNWHDNGFGKNNLELWRNSGGNAENRHLPSKLFSLTMNWTFSIIFETLFFFNRERIEFSLYLHLTLDFLLLRGDMFENIPKCQMQK